MSNRRSRGERPVDGPPRPPDHSELDESIAYHETLLERLDLRHRRDRAVAKLLNEQIESRRQRLRET